MDFNVADDIFANVVNVKVTWLRFHTLTSGQFFIITHILYTHKEDSVLFSQSDA